MDKEQVLKVIEKGESQDVEFKESFHSSQEVSKFICAFANTYGGVIVLGVNKHGKAVVLYSGHPGARATWRCTAEARLI